MKWTIRLTLVLVATLMTGAAPVETPPQVAEYRALWEGLPADYEPDHSVVLLSREITSSGNINRETTVYALRNAAHRDELMNVRLFLSASAEIKKLEGWSYDLATGHLAVTNERDVHEELILDYYRLITMVIPGAPDSGLVGIRMISSDRYYPTADFSTPYPLREGHYSVAAPGVDTPENEREWRRLRQTFLLSGETDVTWEELPGGGWKMMASFIDIPPRPRTTYIPMNSGTAAYVKTRTRPEVWSWFARLFGRILENEELPRPLREHCARVAADFPPRKKVEFVIGFLDDPANFRLEAQPGAGFGAARGVFRGEYDPQKTWIKHGGWPMDKAVLGHLMLRELEMESFIAFGTSRFSRELDPLWDGPGDMDVVLLHIPIEGTPDFLWSLSDPTVPAGVVGKDLNPHVIVMDKSRTSLWMRPRFADAVLVEQRKTVWNMDSDSRVAGVVSWTYQGEPWLRGVNPWDVENDLDQRVRAELSPGLRLAGATWSGFPEAEATESESPVEDHRDRVGSTCGTIQIKLEGETGGLREDAMEFHPFAWRCPELLRESAEVSSGYAVLVPRSILIEEQAVAPMDGRTIISLPDSILVENPWGSFSSSWGVDNSTLVARRVLQLRSGDVRPDQIHYLNEIAMAWGRATDAAVEMSTESEGNSD